jgi:hypothetical protein
MQFILYENTPAANVDFAKIMGPISASSEMVCGIRGAADEAALYKIKQKK